MADDADIADERIERASAAMRAEIANRPLEAPFLGYCLYCKEPTSPTLRWCDVDCREGWQDMKRKELLASRRQGIR